MPRTLESLNHLFEASLYATFRESPFCERRATSTERRFRVRIGACQGRSTGLGPPGWSGGCCNVEPEPERDDARTLVVLDRIELLDVLVQFHYRGKWHFVSFSFDGTLLRFGPRYHDAVRREASRRLEEALVGYFGQLEHPVECVQAARAEEVARLLRLGRLLDALELHRDLGVELFDLARARRLVRDGQRSRWERREAVDEVRSWRAELTVAAVCQDCGGLGWVPDGVGEMRCRSCGGTGRK